MEDIRRIAWRGIEPLLYAIVVFGPWSIDPDSGLNHQIFLGLCFLFGTLAAFAIPPSGAGIGGISVPFRVFAAAAGLLLLYVLISAVNARAHTVLGRGGVGLIYRDAIPWLPHSYDADATWMAWVRQWSTVAVFFGTWRWMKVEVAATDQHRRRSQWPPGLRRFLWVLSVSSGIMALEAILQRASGSNDLLFTAPRILWGGEHMGQFSLGPFPYQGTGSQYFNLVWPLTAGFWWCNQKLEWERTGIRPRFGASANSILLCCIAPMIACPLITTSRTGVFTCILEFFSLLVFCSLNSSQLPWYQKLGGIVATLGAFVLSWVFGWGDLAKKITQSDPLANRLGIFDQARRMIPDFDPWGSGAASFGTVSHLYTEPTSRTWEAYVHNDWLEARLSYGLVGFPLLLFLIGSWFWAWWAEPRRNLPKEFPVFAGVSIAGLLAEACTDFPFETLAIRSLFVVVTAITLYFPYPSGIIFPKKR